MEVGNLVGARAEARARLSKELRQRVEAFSPPGLHCFGRRFVRQLLMRDGNAALAIGLSHEPDLDGCRVVPRQPNPLVRCGRSHFDRVFNQRPRVRALANAA